MSRQRPPADEVDTGPKPGLFSIGLPGKRHGLALAPRSRSATTMATVADATGFGGGIATNNGPSITLINTTISDNSAGTGGGIYHSGGAVILLANTIVAGNAANTSGPELGTGPDIFGSVGSGGHNLIGDTSGSNGITNGTNNDIVNPNPGLGTLASNGGPTQTMALQFGSPALNAGDATYCANPLPPPVSTTGFYGNGNGAGNVDQRGIIRPQGATCDIGAFEAQVTPATPNAPDLQAASDTGTSSTDNKTKNATNLAFDISGVTVGATVDLIRDGNVTPVATGTASGTTIALTDPVLSPRDHTPIPRSRRSRARPARSPPASALTWTPSTPL